MNEIFIFFILIIFVVVIYSAFYIIAFIFAILLNFFFAYVDTIYVKVFGKSFLFYFDLFPAKLSSEQESYLEKHLKYFILLPDKKKKFFKSRVSRFIKNKEFIGKEGLEVNEEMKVLIAASAIRLTFGLRYYLFDSFENIMIYPHEYYSKFSKSTNVGQVTISGLMVFSWKHLLYGYQYGEDNLNVGFHEFAHALYIEEKTNDGISDEMFSTHFKAWDEFTHTINARQQIIDKKLFNNYAWKNDMEFFAVIMENFFETPDIFKKELPELFELTCKMLNQNPLTFASKEI